MLIEANQVNKSTSKYCQQHVDSPQQKQLCGKGRRIIVLSESEVGRDYGKNVSNDYGRRSLNLSFCDSLHSPVEHQSADVPNQRVNRGITPPMAQESHVNQHYGKEIKAQRKVQFVLPGQHTGATRPDVASANNGDGPGFVEWCKMNSEA